MLNSTASRSRIDLDRRCHSGDQVSAIRCLIYLDMYRHTLGKAHPSEDRVHRGKPLLVSLRVRDVDATRDAADLAANDLAVAH